MGIMPSPDAVSISVWPSIPLPSLLLLFYLLFCFQFFSHFCFVFTFNLSFCFSLSLICGSISSADALVIEKGMVWSVLSDWQTTVLELNTSLSRTVIRAVLLYREFSFFQGSFLFGWLSGSCWVLVDLASSDVCYRFFAIFWWRIDVGLLLFWSTSFSIAID